MFLALVSHSHLSKRDLERLCRLSRPTVDKILHALLSHRLVIRDGYGISTGGRRSALYKINRRYKYVTGIDFELPRLNLVLCDLSGEVLRHKTLKVPMRKSDDPEGVIRFAARQVRHLVEGTNLSLDRLVGVGVGAPGFIQNETLTLSGETLPTWRKVPARAWVEEELGAPVVLGNDAGFMALAESLHLAQPERVLIYLVLRQGIQGDIRMGGAVLIDERVFWGANGNAVSLRGAFVQAPHQQKQLTSLLEKQLLPSVMNLVSLFDPGRLIFQARLLGEQEQPFIQNCARRLKAELGERFQNVIISRAQEGECACAKGAALYVLQDLFSEAESLMDRLTGLWGPESRAMEVPRSGSLLALSNPKHP